MTKLFISMKNKNFYRDLLLFTLALAILAFSLFRLWTDSKNPADRVKTLVFTHDWEGKEEILTTLINEFEELNNGIRINVAKGGITGDIIAMHSLMIPEFLKQELIEPETFTLLTFFHPLYYNTDILAENGFIRPPRTRSEFLAQARTISAAENGIYAIAMALEKDNVRSHIRDLYSWILASGNTSITEREAADIRDFILLLEREKLLFPGAFDMDENEKRNAFIEGKTAFMIGTAEDMEFLRQSLGEALDYTAIPVPDNYIGRPVFAAGSWSLGIARGSAYRDEALAFIEFLTGRSSSLVKDWAVPADGNINTVQDAFYSKARELYISGDLIDNFEGIDFEQIRLEITGNL